MSERRPVELESAEDLIPRYEAFLFDAYGVLIDGAGVVEGASDFLAALARAKRPFFVLTNDASRTTASAAAHYERLGLEIPVERVITSGSLVAPFFASRGLAGSRCTVLGPEDSCRTVRDAGGQLLPIGEAPIDVLVVADEVGYPLHEALDATLTALFRTLEGGRAPVLLLPNPDLIFPTGKGAVGIAAGSIAALIEAALAVRHEGREDLRFHRLGKPFAPIFDEALRRAGTRRAVMFGDSLSTDIRGARDAGIDSVLVGTGVTDLAATRYRDVVPTYVVRGLGRPPG